ncbi:Flavinator of succinate dehydrogenase [Fragilaria crotonensis]|nr:Flavinator of succinate dehydrogenase [Fragilaria crotonensis]
MSMRSVLSATALSRRALRLSTTTTKASGIRFYRGESGDAETRNLSAKEQELLTVAMPRSDAIMERHVRFPKLSEIPRASLGPPQDELVSDEELELQVRKKRLVYRSKQRGWLEVDLLLGTWANENAQLVTGGIR